MNANEEIAKGLKEAIAWGATNIEIESEIIKVLQAKDKEIETLQDLIHTKNLLLHDLEKEVNKWRNDYIKQKLEISKLLKEIKFWKTQNKGLRIVYHKLTPPTKQEKEEPFRHPAIHQKEFKRVY